MYCLLGAFFGPRTFVYSIFVTSLSYLLHIIYTDKTIFVIYSSYPRRIFVMSSLYLRPIFVLSSLPEQDLHLEIHHNFGRYSLKIFLVIRCTIWLRLEFRGLQSAWFFSAHLLFFHAHGRGFEPAPDFWIPGQHFGAGTFLV